MNKEVIKDLIAQADTKNALNELKVLTNGMDNDIKNQALLLMSQYNSITIDSRKGIIKYEDLQIGYNRVNDSILSFLEELPDISQPLEKNQPLEEGDKNVLFISANPLKERLMVDVESREVKKQLRRSTSKFIISSEFGIDRETLKYLRGSTPKILHLAGHSSRDGEGFFIHGEEKEYELISNKELFDYYLSKTCINIECVLLNIEYSEKLGELFRKISPITIGISKIITDEAALKFSTMFYSSLSIGQTYKEAFENGIKSLSLVKMFYNPRDFGYNDKTANELNTNENEAYYFWEKN